MERNTGADDLIWQRGRRWLPRAQLPESDLGSMLLHIRSCLRLDAMEGAGPFQRVGMKKLLKLLLVLIVIAAAALAIFWFSRPNDLSFEEWRTGVPHSRFSRFADI